MQLSTQTIEDVTRVILPPDKLDASNAAEFKAAVAPILTSQSKIIFDLSQLHFVDSSGLGTILSCLRLVNSSGGDLKLCCLQRGVRALFELVRMHRVFDIGESVSDAVLAFKTVSAP